MNFEMADKMVVSAQTLTSSEADFTMHTWEFELKGDTQVGGGDYAIIPRLAWARFVDEYIANKKELVSPVNSVE